MGLRDNTGMKAIWSVSAIILTILFALYLQSISFMFSPMAVQVLQYLVLVFGFVSVLIMW
jgi:hypothetical protein